MVSAQIKGTSVRGGYYTPAGNFVTCWGPLLVDMTGAGGSSEGTVATAFSQSTSWRLGLSVPMEGPAYPGCKLMIQFKLAAASAIDKSDGVISLPITRKDLSTGKKTVQYLSNTSFGTATDVVSGDYGTWTDYADGTGSAIIVQPGEVVAWGSSDVTNLAFLSIENGA